MADTKISALTNGAPAQGTEELPVALGGSNYKLTTGDVALLALQDGHQGAITVEAATTAALAGSPVYANGAAGVGATLTKGSNGAFPSQDGVASVVGNVYLVKNQATQTQNGVYELTTLGTAGTPWVLTRTTDSDQPAELNAQIVIVGAGTVNKRRLYSQTTPTPTIGTSNIVYTQTPAPNMSAYLDKATYDPAAFAAQVMVTSYSRTVAQMQALAAGSGFIAGQLYLITNAAVAQGTCALTIMAITVNKLAQTGVGTFQNASMGSAVVADMGYDIINDKILSIQVNKLPDGTATNVYITENTNAPISVWPFDSTTIKGFYAIDPAIGGSVSGTITNVRLGGNTTIVCDATSFIENVIAGSGSAVQAIANGADVGTIANCRIGNNSIVTMNGWIMSNTTIGDGKNVDTASLLPGGIITGAVWIGELNTIHISNANCAANELRMSGSGGVIDMTIFPWAGELYITGDGATALDQITNIPTGAVVKLCNDGTTNTLIINDTTVASGNIYLEVSGGVINLNKDYPQLQFLQVKYDGTTIMQQSAMLRV